LIASVRSGKLAAIRHPVVTAPDATSLEARPIPPPITARCEQLEPVGGALPLHSAFYMTRPADAHFHAAIDRRDSIVLIKGARQVGKTSLLARGLQQARDAGSRVAMINVQLLNAAEIQTAEALLHSVAEMIA